MGEYWCWKEKVFITENKMLSIIFLMVLICNSQCNVIENLNKLEDGLDSLLDEIEKIKDHRSDGIQTSEDENSGFLKDNDEGFDDQSLNNDEKESHSLKYDALTMKNKSKKAVRSSKFIRIEGVS